jgi:hypothetical protein
MDDCRFLRSAPAIVFGATARPTSMTIATKVYLIASLNLARTNVSAELYLDRTTVSS